MGYSNKENATYWAARSLAEDYSSVDDWIDVREVSIGSFYLVWASAAATDAVVKLQETHDKADATGIDVSGKTVTIGAATGLAVIPLTSITSPYVRLAIVDNAESAGTVNVRYFFKGDR